jgi:hypothetical protein
MIRLKRFICLEAFLDDMSTRKPHQDSELTSAGLENCILLEIEELHMLPDLIQSKC